MTIDSTTQTERLLAWYDRERRVLPWREDPSPYHVWLSEIMLQQTRVEAVKGYYARFLDALPDIASLAAAEEDVYTTAACATSTRRRCKSWKNTAARCRGARKN